MAIDEGEAGFEPASNGFADRGLNRSSHTPVNF